MHEQKWYSVDKYDNTNFCGNTTGMQGFLTGFPGMVSKFYDCQQIVK